LRPRREDQQRHAAADRCTSVLVDIRQRSCISGNPATIRRLVALAEGIDTLRAGLAALEIPVARWQCRNFS